MEKLTLTTKEAAAMLGISTSTVRQWVLEGRLKAYRVSNSPRSTFLFTREDCLAALQAVPVEPVLLRAREEKRKKAESFTLRQTSVRKELDELLKVRTKGRRND